MKLLRSITRYQLSIAGLFVMALFLLLFRLDMRSFWTDEWYSFRFFDMSLFEYLKYYWQHPDNHPPGFYAITTSFVNFFGRSDVVVRLPAVIGGLWAFVASAFLIKETVVKNRRGIMLLSLLLIATAPYLILIGQTARYFTLAAGAGLSVLYAMLRLIKKPSIARGLWYAFALVVVGYLDYPTLFYSVCGSGAVIALHYFRNRQKRAVYTWLGSGLLAGLVVSPLVPILLAEIRAESLSGPDVLSGGLMAWGMRVLSYGYALSHGMISLPFGIVTVLWLVLFAILGFIFLKRRRAAIPRLAELDYVIVYGAVGLILNTLLFAALERYSPIAFPRYVLLSLYLLFIVLSAFIMRLSASRHIKAVLAGLLVAIHVFGLSAYYSRSHFVDATFFADNRGMFAFVKENAQEGDALLLSDDLPEEIYRWYKERYFEGLVTYDGKIETPADRIWVVAMAHDYAAGSWGSDLFVHELVDRLGSTQWHISKSRYGSPLHDEVVAIKSGVTGVQSYLYKVGAFLVEKRVEPLPEL